MEAIVLIVCGLLAGALGALVGLGGGIIIVPALIYLGSYTPLLKPISPQVAVGTSLLIMIFTGLSSTLSYMKHKTVDYKSGWIFFLGSGPGAIVGAWVNQTLKMSTFNVYFGSFMIFVALLLMFKNRLKPVQGLFNQTIKRTFMDGEGHTYEYGYHPLMGILISFIVGFCSGIFGIGGGSLMVPAMMLIFLFPPHVAIATSMFMIFLSALVSSTMHIWIGNVNWTYALFLIPGAWIGAKVGAWMNTKLKSDTLVSILLIILIFIGLRLIYQGIVG